MAAPDPAVVAVLGGDEREHHIATALAGSGRDVRAFGGAVLDPHAPYRRCRSAREAIAGASWILCPYPGVGENDQVFAPASELPISLSRSLLADSAAAIGGLIIGRATDTIRAVCEDLDISIHETKAEYALAVHTASAVAEAVLSVLIENTNRLLAEHIFVVIGFGATGFAITQLLLATRCEVIVAARSRRDRERARQLGARPVPYDERLAVIETANIVINTVPHRDSVPLTAARGQTTAHIVDIASPPGGMDHQALIGAGLDVNWLRGLAGLRAPLSQAEAQLEFISQLIPGGSPPSALGSRGRDRPAAAHTTRKEQVQ